MSYASLRRYVGELVDSAVSHVALLLQHRGDLSIGAGDLDHSTDLDHAADVGFLDRALHHARGSIGLRRDAGRSRKRAAAVFGQTHALWIVERDDPQFAANGILDCVARPDAHGAVGIDRNLAIIGLHRDRTAVAED